MKHVMASRFNVRSESGFALIEAVVSAAVLADRRARGAVRHRRREHSTGREKARSSPPTSPSRTRSACARCRSTASPRCPRTATVTVDGVTYTVHSKAAWVTDDTGGRRLRQLEQEQRVPAHHLDRHLDHRRRPRPARSRSTRWSRRASPTARRHGTLGVKVVDRNGDRRAGLTSARSTTAASRGRRRPPTRRAARSSARSRSATYTITLNQGRLRRHRRQPAHRTASQKVSAGTVTFKTMDYDIATTARGHGPDQRAGRRDGQADRRPRRSSLGHQRRRARPVRQPHDAAPADHATRSTAVPVQGRPYGLLHRQLRLREPGRPTRPATRPTSVDLPRRRCRWTRRSPSRRPSPSCSRRSTSALTAPRSGTSPTSPSTRCCRSRRLGRPLRRARAHAGAQRPGRPRPGERTRAPTPPAGSMRKDAAILDPGMPYGTYNVCFQDGTQDAQAGRLPTTTLKPRPATTPTTELGASGWTSWTCPTS